MKPLLGMLQMACFIGAGVALFSGQWLLVAAALVSAGLVGLVGNRLTRAVDGISDTGREALAHIPQAMELLRREQYQAAMGLTSGVVTDIRLGGDKALLPPALTLHAVALASVGDARGAEKAVQEASRLTQSLPPAVAAEADGIRHIQQMVRRELALGLPDPKAMVRAVLASDSGVR